MGSHCSGKNYTRSWFMYIRLNGQECVVVVAAPNSTTHTCDMVVVVVIIVTHTYSLILIGEF